jgi:flagellar assembly protein FliH
MTSLFDLPDAGRGHEIPVDLVTAGARGVSLLEFFAVEDEAADRLAQEAAARAAAHSPESLAQERARQTGAMIDAARAEARAEARAQFEAELTARIAVEHERVERMAAEFARDRQRYFAAAEAQVVKLAIAVARRVLQREVTGDPMHLTATVRAALARVQEGSATVLRVHDASGWAEMVGDANISVVEDERLGEGECVLETEVGRVELGVAVQLEEIERGFGELMQRTEE